MNARNTILIYARARPTENAFKAAFMAYRKRERGDDQAFTKEEIGQSKWDVQAE
jgi:hypothetical protein